MDSTNLNLTKENTLALKGIFAIIVLVHHIYQYSLLVDGHVGWMLQASGWLSVSIFFFLSGYGLTKSYLANRGVFEELP